MLKEGALDDSLAIFGLHVSLEMLTSTIDSKPGTLLADAAKFSVVIKEQNFRNIGDISVIVGDR